MTVLWRRSWEVTIGTTRIRNRDPEGNELAVKFEINKSTEREPNTANVRIANLHADKRRRLEEQSSPQLQVVAGYENNSDTIFTGDTRDIWTQKDGVDIWTTIEAEDGGQSYRTADIEESFDENTPVVTVLRACANAMGIGLGNAVSVMADATLDNAGSQFAGGTVLSGPAWRQLNRICQSCSLRWSVQNGVLQLRRAGQPSETRAIRLTPASGLIGSPTRGSKDDRTGRVAHQVKALLIPGLYPGRVVMVNSSVLEGAFMVRRVRYAGDSGGVDWYADLECGEY